ncbi:GNAT family N-acetyltransferase [Candidatus Bathyarchaeota archaeon]|nr:GNAT family N-acetyltransferase [Candidatus Bathyarchaeota archaeon]
MIVGKLVNLKPFGLEDFEFLYKWNNDEEYVGKFEPFEEVSREELRDWLISVKIGLEWFIIETKQGEKVGQLVARRKNDGVINIGYRVIPDVRNQGFCTAAVNTFVEHAFKNLKMVKVTAETNPKNFASRRVLTKVGFKEVGYKEKSVEINGIWLEGILYELTFEEWKKNTDN